MSFARVALRSVPLATVFVLASCAQAPAIPRAPEPPSASASPAEEPIAPSAFELRRREQAEAYTKQGRWADAAAEWDVLALLRPARADYRRELDEARLHIEKAVTERLKAASEARVRGDRDRAQQLYLKVLSLDPDNVAAAQALREIEAERVRHGHASRTVTVAKIDRIAMAPTALRSTASAMERRDLDYGSMLLRQGEYLASIGSFESYLKAHPRDELGRRYLSDAYLQLGQQRLQQGKKEDAVFYLEKATRGRGRDADEINATLASLRRSVAEELYQQGLRIQGVDISRAIALWERALRYDSSHLNAAARLQQGRQMEKNLRAIQLSGSGR